MFHLVQSNKCSEHQFMTLPEQNKAFDQGQMKVKNMISLADVELPLRQWI